MNGIFYKVNRQGQYKNYMDGSFKEMHKAFNELVARAADKGYKLVQRAAGTGGVFLTYSDGKTSVELVCVDSDRDREWLAFYDKCQMEREAKAA